MNLKHCSFLHAGKGNIGSCKRTGVNQWFAEGSGKKVFPAAEFGGASLETSGRAKQLKLKNRNTGGGTNLFMGRTLGWAVQRLEELLEEPVRIRAMVVTTEPWTEQLREYLPEITEGLRFLMNVFLAGT